MRISSISWYKRFVSYFRKDKSENYRLTIQINCSEEEIQKLNNFDFTKIAELL